MEADIGVGMSSKDLLSEYRMAEFDVLLDAVCGVGRKDAIDDFCALGGVV